MNDERFFDLAMKVIACQASDAEGAELDALLGREPGLKTEFERLQADARAAKRRCHSWMRRRLRRANFLPTPADDCKQKFGRRSGVRNLPDESRIAL